MAVMEQIARDKFRTFDHTGTGKLVGEEVASLACWAWRSMHGDDADSARGPTSRSRRGLGQAREMEMMTMVVLCVFCGGGDWEAQVASVG